MTLILFPSAYEQAREWLGEDRFVLVPDEVQIRGDEPGILCAVLKPFEAAEEERNRKRAKRTCCCIASSALKQLRAWAMIVTSPNHEEVDGTDWEEV